MSTPKLKKDLELIQLSPTSFVNRNNLHAFPNNIANGNSFGGCLIYQSLLAAFKTLTDPSQYRCASLHSSFIAKVTHTARVTYKVETLRNGNSIQHRLVKAIQNGKVVYISTLMFVKRVAPIKFGKQPTINQSPIPNHGTKIIANNPFAKRQRFDTHAINETDSHGPLFQSDSHQALVSINCMDFCKPRQSTPGDHLFPASEPIDGPTATSRNSYFWSKVKRPKPSSAVMDNTMPEYMDQLVLGYTSDHSFISTVSQVLGYDFGSEAFTVSLDHTIYFQDTCHKPDIFDWWFSVTKVLKSEKGRSVLSMSMFNSHGEMMAIVNQEAFCVFDNRDNKLILPKDTTMLTKL
ncbi:palmitoyl-CoA hydrolase [Saccharomycopsis crataegensis]|uniref:Palmitoyl-CoA hydrolase n=1 Tax=Saccharomycopsis crataegensis TaxID=43959 RepID=A0AAV5QUM7_9ASCO|nr:palmitoyl-CoA hydrolase [Saccharomycopsis crataegensis]